MKLLFTLCSLFISTVCFAQTITTKSIITSQLPIHSGRTDSGIFYTISLNNYAGGNTGDAVLRRFSSSGTELASVNFPNENPSDNFVNQASFYTSLQNDGYLAYARTWRTNNPLVKSSQSLLYINSDMTFNSSALNLIAYQSSFGLPITVGNKAYVIYTAQQNDAKLIYEDYDDSQNLTSLITNPGAGSTFNSWILEIDYDLNIGSLLNTYLIGNSSDDVSPKGYLFDSLPLSSKPVLFENGFIAFKIVKNSDLQIYIMDPNNLGTPVHVFTGLGEDAHIIMCDNKYYISKSNLNSSGINGIDVYDDNFNLIHQNYALDFSAGRPEELGCLSNDELLVFINMGSGAGFDHMRNGYFTKEAFDKGFEHIPFNPSNSSTVVNFWAYDDVYMIDDTKSLHISAYQGPGMMWGGMTIPATSGPDDYHMVIWEADISLTPATMTFSDTQTGVLDIYMNARYNPNDLTQVVNCGDCREAVITISQNEFNNLPADFGFSNFLGNIINVPTGETLFAANMGTDPSITDPNLNRYMKAETISGGIPYSNSTRGQSFKVYLTPNVMTLSNDEVSIAPVIIYPNPATSFITVNTQESISSYSILNSLGQQVQKGSFPTSAQLDIQKLSKGLYYLQLNDGEQTQSFKFIKE